MTGYKSEEVKIFERENKIELPRDDNSERGVSATLITHPTYIFKSDFLKPKNFINKELGAIYYIIGELSKKGIKDIDTFTILTEIENNPPIEKKIFKTANIKKFSRIFRRYTITIEKYCGRI